MLTINTDHYIIYILKRMGFHHLRRIFLKVYKPIQELILSLQAIGLINFIQFKNDITKTPEGQEITVKLKKYSCPIILRKGTSDIDVFKQIFLHNEYYYKYPKNFSPKLIIDGGANVGYSSIYFARRFPQATIVAIEPEHSNYELLLKNIENYPNIQAIEKGIWYRNIPLKVVHGTGRHRSFRIVEIESGEEGVDAITIPDIITLTKHKQIDILKLDIEGAEEEVFEHNAEERLPRTKMIFMELHERFKKGSGEKILHVASKYFKKKQRLGENIILTN